MSWDDSAMHLLGDGFTLECRLPILSVYRQHAACVTSDLTLAADWIRLDAMLVCCRVSDWCTVAGGLALVNCELGIMMYRQNDLTFQHHKNLTI